MSDAENLARNIAAAREAVGWSRERLAEELRKSGLQTWHATTVARVETGKREVRVGEMGTLAKVFSLSPEALMSPSEQFSRFGRLVRATGRFTDAQGSLITSAMARVHAADELRHALEDLPSGANVDPAWKKFVSKTAVEVVAEVERVLDEEKADGQHQEEA